MTIIKHIKESLKVILILVATTFLWIGCSLLYQECTERHPKDYRVNSVGAKELFINSPLSQNCRFYLISFKTSPVHYRHGLFSGSLKPYSEGCVDSVINIEMFTDSNRAIGKDLYHIKFLSDSLVSVTISKSKFCDNECEFNYYDSFLPFKESLQYCHGCEGIVAIDSDMPRPKFITVRFQNKILSSKIGCPADTCIISGIGLKKHSDPDSDPFYLDSAQIQSFISENANRHE